ncbi:MAG: cytochrome c, partial [Gammaproteobacteria bacterium]
VGGTGGEPGAGGQSAGEVERGRYLVNHVAACIDCHTPRLADGSLDQSRLLSGNPSFTDLVPEDDEAGLVPAPNLTPDETGLLAWSDDEIKNAFLNGVARSGEPLAPIMPYYVFHNMTDEDADAIVSYLRSLPATENEIPERQPLPFPLDEPAAPVPADRIPDTTLDPSDPSYARAQNGRYLAGFIGTCMECHTAQAPITSAVPIDVDRLFAGGRIFDAAGLNLPVPPFPVEIVSPNITPDETGIADLTPQHIVTELLQGIEADGTRLCPPMPAGPMMAFGGLTESDAADIGIYLTTIPPVESDAFPACTPPEEGPGG